MYVEGTNKGLLKVRDVENEGELVMHINSNFGDQSVSVIGYNNDKNMLFAGNKDGNFCVWKVAHEWRSKNAEQAER
jgi:WD40 repeat protein